VLEALGATSASCVARWRHVNLLFLLTFDYADGFAEAEQIEKYAEHPRSSATSSATRADHDADD
jgi:hypothetical protein